MPDPGQARPVDKDNMMTPSLPKKHVPGALKGVALGSIALALIMLAGLAVDRWPFAWDRAIIVAIRTWGGPVWLRHVAIDITALGGGTVLTIVVIAAAGFLIVQKHFATAAATVIAVISGAIIVDFAKAEIARPRPILVEHYVVVTNMSFPSGHAANSALVYLTLAAVAGQIASSRGSRNYMVGVAVLLVGAIGISRVILGVHWPSDVIAGWCFGTLWALGWWVATAKARESFGRLNHSGAR